MRANRPDLSVIIVSYGTRDMTLECLRLLHAGLANVLAEVWVVDNASTDGSADAIRQAYPLVHLVANLQNVGFGAANNQAMHIATGGFFLLLNSDAFVEPGSIASLLEYARAHPQAGVIGPRILNQDHTLQVSCYRFPSPARAWLENLWLSKLFPSNVAIGDYAHWAHDAEQPVDWLIGACMLVRREAFEKVGGFDENFFMYAEESDWQRRIRDAGWQVCFTPDASVVHLGGASGAKEQARINRHFFESLDYYQLKHHGRIGLITLRLAMVIGCGLRVAIWGLVALLVPRRSLARRKLSFHLWLVARQSFSWRFPVRRRPMKGSA